MYNKPLFLKLLYKLLNLLYHILDTVHHAKGEIPTNCLIYTASKNCMANCICNSFRNYCLCLYHIAILSFLIKESVQTGFVECEQLFLRETIYSACFSRELELLADLFMKRSWKLWNNGSEIVNCQELMVLITCHILYDERTTGDNWAVESLEVCKIPIHNVLNFIWILGKPCADIPILRSAPSRGNSR